MPQLNVHVPASSDLVSRVEDAARRLGTTPSALARVVLDVALEPYVQAQLEIRGTEREIYSSRVTTSLRHRFSGALPARPFADTDSEPAESDESGGISGIGGAVGTTAGVPSGAVVSHAPLTAVGATHDVHTVPRSDEDAAAATQTSAVGSHR